MDCDGWRRLACAVEEVARNTEPAGLGAFDIWSRLVLPALIGLGTITLSASSFYVTYKSHRAVEAAREVEELRRRKAERQALLDVAQRVVTQVISQVYRPDAEWSVFFGCRVEMMSLAQANEEPHAYAAYDEFDDLVAEAVEPENRIGALPGAFIGLATKSLQAWARDPEAWLKNTDARVAHTRRSIEETRRSESEKKESTGVGQEGDKA
jgi:hypothetical protein